jgi:hypothetical protein
LALRLRHGGTAGQQAGAKHEGEAAFHVRNCAQNMVKKVLKRWFRRTL